MIWSIYTGFWTRINWDGIFESNNCMDKKDKAGYPFEKGRNNICSVKSSLSITCGAGWARGSVCVIFARDCSIVLCGNIGWTAYAAGDCLGNTASFT